MLNNIKTTKKRIDSELRQLTEVQLYATSYIVVYFVLTIIFG